jgi:phosphoribosylaminoimidazolecarboxamide formyltransferase/IMP cyclohydrolase
VQGKELSYNNLNDTDAAFECVRRVRRALHRHRQARQPLRRGGGGGPLRRLGPGAALRPVSAFGGIVAANRTLDAAAAEKIAAIFTEVVIAPDADEDARPSSPARRTCACC